MTLYYRYGTVQLFIFINFLGWGRNDPPFFTSDLYLLPKWVGLVRFRHEELD